jgi:diguanylate cyclase (GGDEF)-like protein
MHASKILETFRLLFLEMSDAVLVVDSQGTIKEAYIDHKHCLCCNTTRFKVGSRLSDLFAEDLVDTLLVPLAKVWQSGEAQSFRYQISDGDQMRSYEFKLIPLNEYAKGETRVAVVICDQSRWNETDRGVLHSDNLLHMATHDQLTNLPNRVLLKDRLSQLIERVIRNQTLGAVLFIDLDGFKQINDQCGHQAGDVVLQDVVHRLLPIVRATDTLSRFGGDEFVLVLDIIQGVEDVKPVLHKLFCAMQASCFVQEREFRLTLSVGIAMVPANGTDVDRLIRVADKAMYHVKEMGGDGYAFYGEAVLPSSSLG